MITHLQGTLTEKNPAYVVVDCKGVGYLLHVSLNTFSALPETEEIKLFTHLSIREDAHTLYGFIDEAERELFRLLISVSGVGAAIARMALSSLKPDQIKQAIVNEDVTTIKSIKGIGVKTAQRIILDLKDKVAKMTSSNELSAFQHNTNKKEALSALEVLGFSRKQSEGVVDAILKESPHAKVEHIIKQSLKKM